MLSESRTCSGGWSRGSLPRRRELVTSQSGFECSVLWPPKPNSYALFILKVSSFSLSLCSLCFAALILIFACCKLAFFPFPVEHMGGTTNKCPIEATDVSLSVPMVLPSASAGFHCYHHALSRVLAGDRCGTGGGQAGTAAPSLQGSVQLMLCL